jgi:tetratricopeptide (TPR) repeat protein
MVKVIRSIALAAAILMGGCSSVDYRAQQTGDFQPPTTDGVDFWISPSFVPDDLECVTVLPVKTSNQVIDQNVKRQIWEVVLSQVAPLKYRDVVSASGDNLNCRGQISIGLMEMGDSNLVTYSEKMKAVRLSLAVDGQEVWRAQHRLIARSGSLPISPLSLVIGAHSAQENVTDETGYLHDTRLIRRIVSTLPDRTTDPNVIAQDMPDSRSVQLLIDAFRYQEVIDTLKARDNLSAEELWWLGRSYLGVGQSEKALQEFRLLLLLNPKDANYWVGLGLAKQGVGHHEHAIAAFEGALDLEGEQFVSHFELGVSLWGVDRDSAIQHFRKAGSIASRKDQFALATRSLYALQSNQPESLSAEELKLVFN